MPGTAAFFSTTKTLCPRPWPFWRTEGRGFMTHTPAAQIKHPTEPARFSSDAAREPTKEAAEEARKSAGATSTTMKALTFKRYGKSPDIGFSQVAQPVLQANEILVQVHAAAVNPIDNMVPVGTPPRSSTLTSPPAPVALPSTTSHFAYCPWPTRPPKAALHGNSRRPQGSTAPLPATMASHGLQDLSRQRLQAIVFAPADGARPAAGLCAIGPVNTDFTGAKPAGQAPIKARVAAQTGRLGKTRNAEWRLASRLPFGLEPKRPIAALPILAGSPTQLRLAPGARPFGSPTHPAKSVLTGPSSRTLALTPWSASTPAM